MVDFYEERDQKTLPHALAAKDRLLRCDSVELREQIVETAVILSNRRIWFDIFRYDADMTERLQKAWSEKW